MSTAPVGNPYWDKARKFQQGLLAYETTRKNAGNPITGCELVAFRTALRVAERALSSAANDSLWHTLVRAPFTSRSAERNFNYYFEKYMKNSMPASPAQPQPRRQP